MTFAYHHPNYYKRVKREAASSKPQASSTRPQAPSTKLQASSTKRSDQKIPEPRSTNQQ